MTYSKEPKKYIWMREDNSVVLISDPISLWQDPNYKQNKDRIFELGPEVEVEVKISIKNKGTVYRNNASGYRTPFENRD